jgi:CheY-like chemotaxis protein
MPHGGTLTIDTDVITADEHYAAQHPGVGTGRYMRLAVSDDGIGMSRETLERAFEPFFTTKPKGQGTGLGLATIYGIITQAGGHAQIYSELGHGTTIAALLPVTGESAGPAAQASGEPLPGAGETILLVEDDEGLRALTERVLDRNGYTVRSARTAAEARAIAGGIRDVDLLLTDVVLPDMHGPDMVALLHEEQPGLRVVYMSGYAESILAARGTLPAGAVLLQKPVSSRHLLTVIARELRSHRAAQSPTR